MPTRPRILAPNERQQRKRGRAGQNQRKKRLARTHGLCERCLDCGRTSIATVVNHKIPLAMGGTDDDHNTENLCNPCDKEVTAQQFGFVIPTHRGVARNGRPTSPDHPWNTVKSASGSSEEGG
jgi:5-methylcytosine-specific restriction protein A